MAELAAGRPRSPLLSYERGRRRVPLTPADVNSHVRVAHRRRVHGEGLPHAARHDLRGRDARADRHGRHREGSQARRAARRRARPPRRSATPPRSRAAATSIPRVLKAYERGELLDLDAVAGVRDPAAASSAERRAPRGLAWAGDVARTAPCGDGMPRRPSCCSGSSCSAARSASRAVLLLVLPLGRAAHRSPCRRRRSAINVVGSLLLGLVVGWLDDRHRRARARSSAPACSAGSRPTARSRCRSWGCAETTRRRGALARGRRRPCGRARRRRSSVCFIGRRLADDARRSSHRRRPNERLGRARRRRGRRRRRRGSAVPRRRARHARAARSASRSAS